MPFHILNVFELTNNNNKSLKIYFMIILHWRENKLKSQWKISGNWDFLDKFMGVDFWLAFTKIKNNNNNQPAFQNVKSKEENTEWKQGGGGERKRDIKKEINRIVKTSSWKLGNRIIITLEDVIEPIQLPLASHSWR